MRLVPLYMKALHFCVRLHRLGLQFHELNAVETPARIKPTVDGQVEGGSGCLRAEQFNNITDRGDPLRNRYPIASLKR